MTPPFHAPAGTIAEFLTNLGITDADAVQAIKVNSFGQIEVEVKLRAPDGGFMVNYDRGPNASSLPRVVTAVLSFVESEENEDAAETHVIEAFNTAAAYEKLFDIVAKSQQDIDAWVVLSDVGERGKLRTFIFEAV